MVRANVPSLHSDTSGIQIEISTIRLTEQQKRAFAVIAAERAKQVMSAEEWAAFRASASDPLQTDIDMICRDDTAIKTRTAK